MTAGISRTSIANQEKILNRYRKKSGRGSGDWENFGVLDKWSTLMDVVANERY